MPEIVVSPPPAASTAAQDQAISQGLLDRVAGGELARAFRTWAPVRAIALTRLDDLRSGAPAACELAAQLGFDPVRRVSGGHAVVLGSGSFCVGFAEPAATFEGTQQR